MCLWMAHLRLKGILVVVSLWLLLLPSSRWRGTPPCWQGVPHSRSRQGVLHPADRGVPHQRSWRGYHGVPPCPGLDEVPAPVSKASTSNWQLVCFLRSRRRTFLLWKCVDCWVTLCFRNFSGKNNLNFFPETMEEVV